MAVKNIMFILHHNMILQLWSPSFYHHKAIFKVTPQYYWQKHMKIFLLSVNQIKKKNNIYNMTEMQDA